MSIIKKKEFTLKYLQQFVEEVKASKNAGSKAVNDVTEVLTRLGYEPISICRRLSDNLFFKMLGRLEWFVKCPLWRTKVKRGARLVVQFTFSCFHGPLTFRLIDETFKKNNNLYIISIIHDLNRGDPINNCITPVEKRFFELCDRIIVHNDRMRDFLIKHGVPAKKMVCLEVFDYLIEDELPLETAFHPDKISIAGNLNPVKCGYLKVIHKIKGVEWNLFGLGADESLLSENVKYRGSFNPNHPPIALRGGYGLVWDGDSAETCSGLFGEYMRVNNPHKMSLYLAMGIPVIVWSGAAVASFVERNRLGLIVGSLFEIPHAVSSAKIHYSEFVKNVSLFSNRLRTGGFTTRAILSDD